MRRFLLFLCIFAICTSISQAQKVSISKDLIVGSEQMPSSGQMINDSIMFFNVNKCAFRAGSISSSGTFWSPENIGNYSFAVNRNTIASGDYSTAFGNRTVASGTRSFAIGYFTEALGSYSFASGERTEAQGSRSASFGRYTLADSYASVAVGQYNIGGGNADFWMGSDPIFEVGIGQSNLSRENGLTILKNGTVSFKEYTFPNTDGDSSQVLITNGNGQMSWQQNKGEFEKVGELIKVVGDTEVDFIVGHHELPPNGSNPLARMLFFDESKGAVRAGSATTSAWSPDSLGQSSFATGHNTKALSSQSAAFGNGTRAEASNSFATGGFTEATGFYTSTMGFRTRADAYGSMALGRYNVGGGSNYTWVVEDPLLEVGMGEDEANRSNALTITKNGDVLFGQSRAPIQGADFGGGAFYYSHVKNSLLVGNSHNNAWSPDSIGLNAFGIGNRPIAKGYASMSLGNESTASGTSSLALGWKCMAAGSASNSLGYYTKTVSARMTALGSYNVGLGAEKVVWLDTDPILEVGIGQDEGSRENAMTILKNGKTGIGTHQPEEILDVRGTAQFSLNSNSATPQLRLEEDGDDYSRLTFSNKSINTGNYWTFAGRVNAFDSLSRMNIFYKDFGNVMNFYGDGRVFLPHRLGIGDSTPDAAFDIHSDADEDPLHVHVGNADKMRVYQNGSIALGGLYAGSTDDVFIVNQLGLGASNPTFRLQVENNAIPIQGHARATAWTVYSDARVKSNVNETKYGLHEVLKLRPVEYDHHTSTFGENGLEVKDDHSREVGFIAQEVYEIIEEIVYKPKDEELDLWSMNYEKLTPVLVKAIQELDSEKKEMSKQLMDQQLRIQQLEEYQRNSENELAELKTMVKSIITSN